MAEPNNKEYLTEEGLRTYHTSLLAYLKNKGIIKTASKLETPRTIKLSGDVTGEFPFDGTSDIDIHTEIADDSHNHKLENITDLNRFVKINTETDTLIIENGSMSDTPALGDNTKKISTTEFVNAAVNDALSKFEGMKFQGIIDSNRPLPTTGYVKGWTYIVGEDGIYASKECTIGDMVVCINSYNPTSASDNDWEIIHKKADGLVYGPVSAVVNHIAIFDTSSGKSIKDSGYTIEQNVPNATLIGYTIGETATDTKKGLMSPVQYKKLEEVDINKINTSISKVVRDDTVDTDTIDYNYRKITLGMGSYAKKASIPETIVSDVKVNDVSVVENGVAKISLGEYIEKSEKGIAGGVAELDGEGRVPASQLPSFVDDIIEVDYFENLPNPGEAGKIYVILYGEKANHTYRWSGSTYVEVTAGPIIIGTEPGTAFDGGAGAMLSEQMFIHLDTVNNPNPHKINASTIGLDAVDNTRDMAKPVSTAQQEALDKKVSYTVYDAHANNFENPHNVTKEQVELGNVDNTSDLDKPVSRATEIELSLIRESKLNITDVINALDSQEELKALSARQGTVLNGKIQVIDTNIKGLVNPFKFKGVVETFADLPTNADNADLYQVKDEDKATYAWTGGSQGALPGEWLKVAVAVADVESHYATLNEIFNMMESYEG